MEERKSERERERERERNRAKQINKKLDKKWVASKKVEIGPIFCFAIFAEKSPRLHQKP